MLARDIHLHPPTQAHGGTSSELLSRLRLTEQGCFVVGAAFETFEHFAAMSTRRPPASAGNSKKQSLFGVLVMIFFVSWSRRGAAQKASRARGTKMSEREGWTARAA